MSKYRKDKNSGSQSSKLTPLSIPKVFITSDEEDPTPHRHSRKEDFPINLLLQGQGFTIDEDSGSTAPLLDSGAATPLCEEPSVPLNMGNFLASSQKLKNEISSEEICLSSLDGDKDLEVSSKESGENQLNDLPDYPFVKWPWKYIRIISTLAAILAILACFGSSATLIAHLPQRCDPSTEWWQGKIFYELFPASFYDSDGDGVGDLHGITSKLDYLQKELHVDALRLNSICQASDYPENYLDIVNATRIDPRLGDTNELQNLIVDLETRNMSLVLDIHIDSIPGLVGSSQVTQQQHLLVESVLRYWLHHGVHGFYIKGLEKFAHQSDLWKNIARWKTSLDTFSSRFSKKRILIASSDFIFQYLLQHPLQESHVLKQLDLIDHNLNLENPSQLEDKIREVLKWDNDIDKPWIMWNVGTLEKNRLVDFFRDTNECVVTSGVLMLALSLPGSASVLYGDEIGLQSGINATVSGLETTGVMQWNEELKFDPTLPTPLPWFSSEEKNDCLRNSVETFGKISAVRNDALPLHTNAILKYDQDVLTSRTHNFVYKVLLSNTVVIERFYPRRHRYLLILNLDIKNVTHDLSNTYFGGQTLVSSSGRKQGYVKLNQLTLLPGEGLLLLLDK